MTDDTGSPDYNGSSVNQRSEDELSEMRDRFRILTESSLTGVYLIQEGRFLYVNPAMARMFGYAVDEIVHHLRTSDLVYAGDRPLVEENIRRRLEGTVEEMRYLFRGVRKDGSVFPVEVHGRRIERAGKPAVMGTLIDNTDRQWADLELRRQEKEFQQILDVTPLLLAVFGPDRKRLYANRATLEYFGLSLAEWQSVSDPLWFYHPEDRERMSSLYATTSTETSQAFEARIRRRDGEYRWFLFRDIPLQDDTGAIKRWYFSATDIEDRKRAEDQFRSTAAEMKHLMASVPDCLWSAEIDKDRNWSYRYYSPAVEQITGRPPSFFIQDPGAWLGIVHAEDRRRVAIAAERLMAGEVEKAEDEYRIVYLNGDLRWIRDSAVATRIDKGLRIDGVVSDITARKCAEDELRASEIRFRTLVDHAADAILLRGDDGKLIDVNQYACESLGYTREELKGMTPRDLVDPNEDPAFFRSVDERLKAGEVFAFESAFRRKDGAIFPIEVRVRPFSQGGERLYLAIARDITDRKRTERELRESEARFRTFADHATDAFFVHDERGTIVDVNREACESLGYTREELIGMHPYDLDCGQATPPTPVTKARLEAGETVTFESVIRRKDGRLYPVEWRIRPYQRGENRFALSSARDITERKRAEEERERLRELEAELAHINRVNVIGEMTASIAHEINQPLSGIVSNGEACLLWLSDDSPNLEEAREAARRIVRDGARVGEIISRIRSLVKKSPPPKTKLDLNETVGEVVALLADEAKRREVTIQTEFSENLVFVVGDRVQLQQVVLNLVMNAMDAMRETISRRVRITTFNTEPDEVCVAVQDTGVGLDPNNLTKIFDPFYSTKSGMGMGLSISRSIVQSHGGRLWAATNQDGGVTVQFALPRCHDGASIAST